MTNGYSNHFYNRYLQPNANRLRKEMTKAEACLWKYALRAGKMKGFQFRRQRPVLIYIADFMCKELMLIIEVDGSIHQLEDVMKNDLERQKALEEAGFTVLRFTNEEVLENINAVFCYLEDWIEKKIGK
jgi:very-short-patch-repair endonuclease